MIASGYFLLALAVTLVFAVSAWFIFLLVALTVLVLWGDVASGRLQ